MILGVVQEWLSLIVCGVVDDGVCVDGVGSGVLVVVMVCVCACAVALVLWDCLLMMLFVHGV